MSNFCEDCERLHDKADGTAAERPHFQQPTKYDHYNNFQKFKQAKEEELMRHKIKEDDMKFNPNFTNFHLNQGQTEETYEQFTPQNITKYRLQSCADSWDNSTNQYTDKMKEDSCTNDSQDSDNDNKSLQKRKSLLVLTRTPVQCPISLCKRTLGVTFVLSHYLRDHNEDFGVPCQEIYAGKRSILIFDPTDLNLHENVCLGILAYGGDIKKRSSRPCERGLCIHNAFLPKPYEHLATHLPILIVASRTYWSSLSTNGKERKHNLHNPNNMNQEVIVIWLVSAQTVKPIHCTVTLYDKLMTSSRSAILQIRDLCETQIPQEFMLQETNFISLSNGEINILSQQRSEFIHMEIMINEHEIDE